MELYVSEEALKWLKEQGYPDVDDNYVDAYDFGDWLDAHPEITYTGDPVDGFVVTVNASESYKIFPNNEFEG